MSYVRRAGWNDPDVNPRLTHPEEPDIKDLTRMDDDDLIDYGRKLSDDELCDLIDNAILYCMDRGVYRVLTMELLHRYTHPTAKSGA